MKKFINEHEMKCIIFEIYSAGYVDGMNSEIYKTEDHDIRTDFNKYFEQLKQLGEKQ